MNDVTLMALKGSIRKWQKIVAGTGEDNGWCNCPLCTLFLNGEKGVPGTECNGCPVHDFTTKQFCYGSPYEEWPEHQNVKHYHAKRIIHPDCPDCKRLAQAELDFLKSLLPKPEDTP